MRTIIAGGRNYFLTPSDIEKLNSLKSEITEVVSGAATGADAGGEKWAHQNNIPVTLFKANWKLFGKSAGHRRNRQMAEYAEAVILFPGGTGTENMFHQAQTCGLKIYDWRKESSQCP